MKYLYSNPVFLKNKENKFYAFKLQRYVLLCLTGLVSIFLIPHYSFAQQKIPTNSNKTFANTPTVLENCNCADNVILPKKGTYFYQTIRTFANYHDLKQAMDWLLVDGEKTFNALYFKNFQSDVGGLSGQGSAMTVVAINTLVKFTHLDNTYTINLTPCKSDTHTFELPFVMNRSYDILNYDRDFKYEDFDHSAQAYLRIIFLRLDLHPDVVLTGLLTEMIDNDGPKRLRFNRFIQTSNKKYDISIPRASSNKTKDKTYIPLILKALKAKYINPEEVINDEFILTDPSTHLMNNKEKDNLSGIISEFYDGGFNLDNIDKQMLQPQYRAGVDVKHIGVEISDKVIRSWDIVNKRPILDSNNKPVPSKILAEVPSVEFSSDQGISAKIKSVCFSTSEISGTGIILNFDHSVLVDKSIETETSFSEYNYPLFRIMPKRGEKDKTVDGMTIATYDTLITKFSGLLVNEAKISIPYKSDTINTSVKNLIINNKLISGEINLKIDQSQGVSNESVNLNIGNRIMVVNIKDLQKDLYKKGIKDVHFEITKNYLIILFKKTYHI